MNVYTRDDVRFASGQIDLAVGESAVRFADGCYQVRARLKDESVAIDATWTPQAEAVRIENMGGFINTFIVPRLATSGEVVIRGRRVVLRAVPGYHDHNWGTWDWSRDLGWNWGYLLDEPSSGSTTLATSIVFGQVTDATRSAARTELVLHGVARRRVDARVSGRRGHARGHRAQRDRCAARSGRDGAPQSGSAKPDPRAAGHSCAGRRG